MPLNNWIPPAFQRKASAVTRAVVQIFNGQPVWTPRNFNALSKEGFEANVWVYRWVMAFALAAAGVEWNLYQQRGKKKKEIEEHALLDLLYRPNPFQSKAEYIEAVVAFLLLSGNTYQEKNGPDNGPPKELWPLRPDRVKILPDPVNFIKGYEYKVGSETVPLDTSRVMHSKLFAPLDDFYGLSQLAVAGRGVDNDNAANKWNNSLLNNSARPSGAMVTKESLNDSQYDRLKYQIDTMYKGADKAGKAMLLEGGLDWKEMGLSPKDMDYIESKKLSRVEICAAFGVPPEIVGDKEHATYSNYQEARQAFYQDCVLPILDRLRDKWNGDLVPLFGENLYLDYDRDGIEALQESREKIWDRVLRAHAQGLLMDNEARDVIGYESVEGGNVRRIPLAVELVGPDAPAPVNPTEPTPPASPDDDPKPNGPEGKAFGLSTDEQKTLFWKSMDRRRNGYARAAEQKVKAAFEAERKRVAKAIKDGGNAEETINAGKKELAKILTAIDTLVITEFGQSLFNQLKSDGDALAQEFKAGNLNAAPYFFNQIKDELGFNVFDMAVQNWIADNVAQKVVLVTDTTKALIREQVAEAEAEGESVPDLAKRIDALYLDQIIPKRSTVIARTEVISASNAGNRFAAKQTNLPLHKEWISTRDDRTRDSHKHLDGEEKEIDEQYSNGLMFPGDPSGKAKEVIQCRCTEGYAVKRVKP